MFGKGGVEFGCWGKAVVATGNVEVLEDSICIADEIYGKDDHMILKKDVLSVVWKGRGGGICAPGVHIQSLRGCNEYVVGDAGSGPVGEVVELCI